ncbi:MAG: hypothetical protein ACI395_10135 [Candidatus Cryptobacteroides sp.]
MAGHDTLQQNLALAQAFDYFDSVVGNDIKRVADINSIATAALGVGPDDLINDMKTFGFIFETLAGIGDYAYKRPEDGVLLCP